MAVGGGGRGPVVVVSVVTLAAVALGAVGSVAVAQEVDDEAALRAAFADASTAEISLAGDVELADCGQGALSRPAGADDLVVDGGGHTVTQTCTGARVIDSASGALSLVALTVTGGTLDAGAEVAEGGGIYSAGPLTLDRVTVSGNRAEGDLGGLGGGVAGAGAVTVVDSTISGNVAGGGISVFGGRGGGLSAGGLLTVEGSEVSGNRAAGAVAGGGQSGGAYGQASVLVAESTLAGNVAAAGSESGSGSMGALAADGDLALENVTVSGNVAAGGASLVGGVTAAGVVLVAYSTIVGNEAATRAANLAVSFRGRIFGSVIAEGSGGAPGCATTAVTSEGFNASDDPACGLDAGSDLVGGGDLGLAGLADNGGGTRTRALETGSPLLDAIPPGSCQDGLGAGVVIDQRGVDRPDGAGCDIGAFEGVGSVQPTPTPTESPSPTPTPTASPSASPSRGPSPSAAPTESPSARPSGGGSGGGPPTVGPRPGGRPFAGGGVVVGPGAPPSKGGPLAFTGLELGVLALVAAGLLVGGWLLLRARRRSGSGGGS